MRFEKGCYFTHPHPFPSLLNIFGLKQVVTEPTRTTEMMTGNYIRPWETNVIKRLRKQNQTITKEC